MIIENTFTLIQLREIFLLTQLLSDRLYLRKVFATSELFSHFQHPWTLYHGASTKFSKCLLPLPPAIPISSVIIINYLRNFSSKSNNFDLYFFPSMTKKSISINGLIIDSLFGFNAIEGRWFCNNQEMKGQIYLQLCWM